MKRIRKRLRRTRRARRPRSTFRSRVLRRTRASVRLYKKIGGEIKTYITPINIAATAANDISIKVYNFTPNATDTFVTNASLTSNGQAAGPGFLAGRKCKILSVQYDLTHSCGFQTPTAAFSPAVQGKM